MSKGAREQAEDDRRRIELLQRELAEWKRPATRIVFWEEDKRLPEAMVRDVADSLFSVTKSTVPMASERAGVLMEAFFRIGELRGKLAAAEAQRDELQRRLEMAEANTVSAMEWLEQKERAEVAEAQRERATDALKACEAQWRRPGEGHNDYFERQAERFYRLTGLMAPGKSQPLEMGNVDNENERRDAWERFFNEPWDKMQAALSATDGGVTPPRRDGENDAASGAGANQPSARVDGDAKTTGSRRSIQRGRSSSPTSGAKTASGGPRRWRTEPSGAFAWMVGAFLWKPWAGANPGSGREPREAEALRQREA